MPDLRLLQIASARSHAFSMAEEFYVRRLHRHGTAKAFGMPRHQARFDARTSLPGIAVVRSQAAAPKRSAQWPPHPAHAC